MASLSAVSLAKVWSKDKALQEDEAAIEEADAEPGMTGQDKLQGTVMYMSPEQIECDPGIGARSDIYSLGSVLYETLTGLTPFQGDGVQKLLQQVKNDTPQDPRNVSKTPIPDVLAELCLQCLRKDPHERPVSAAELVRTLREDWRR